MLVQMMKICNMINYDEMIDCAAIKTSDGRIWTGKRHFHCLATIKQATGEKAHNAIQGFVTMERNDNQPQGRFVTREEAYKLALAAGQIIDDVCPGTLYSESLY